MTRAVMGTEAKPVFCVSDDNDSGKASSESSVAVQQLMQRHFLAIEHKDLDALAKTLSPDGQLTFILPSTPVTQTTTAFLDYHREWFRQTGWTMRNTIESMQVSECLADVVVEAFYQESERNGKPYFNRLMVSYTVKKTAGSWYVIKDHATSVEKSPGY